MSSKIKYILFSFTLLLTGLHPCINTQAQPTSYSYMEELFDGYYATVYVDLQNFNARSSTKTASKTYKISSPSGEVVATYKLTASFSYPYHNFLFSLLLYVTLQVHPNPSFLQDPALHL